MNRLVLIVGIVACLGGCATGAPQSPPMQDIDPAELTRATAAVAAFEALAQTPEWYGVYFQGQKAGYQSIERTVKDDVFEIVTTDAGRSQALGSVTESTSRTTEVFSSQPPYDAVLLELRSGLEQSDGTWRIRQTPSGYVGEYSAGGQLRSEPLFDFQFRLADALAAEIWLRGGAQSGQCLSYPSYRLESFERTFQSECIAEITAHTIDGAQIEAVTTGVVGVATIIRDRYTGRGLSVDSTAYQLEMRLEPRAIATDLSAPIDFLLENIIRVDRPLGDAATIERLTLEFVGLDGPGPGQAPGQHAQPVTDGALRVTVDRSIAHDGALPNPRMLSAALALTEPQQASLSELNDLVRAAGADVGTQAQRVGRLVDFVYDFIEPTFSSEPLSLNRLLATRRGDCTEYSQLLDALLRAARIPTREVTGLVYMGDEFQHFGHHAWNEVYIDGGWLPIDASWNEMPVNATHIRYPLDDMSSMLMVNDMSKVSIQVIDVSYGAP